MRWGWDLKKRFEEDKSLPDRKLKTKTFFSLAAKSYWVKLPQMKKQHHHKQREEEGEYTEKTSLNSFNIWISFLYEQLQLLKAAT